MFLESALESAPSRDAGEALEVCFCDGVGLGVRALVPFSAGAVLDRFTGEISAEIGQHSLQVRPGVHIANTRYVGFLSHGCDPNCRLDMDRFQLIALRDIAAGELLTIDYAATEDVLHVQFACRCAADDCRQWITGRRDQVNPAGTSHLATLAPRLRRA